MTADDRGGLTEHEIEWAAVVALLIALALLVGL